MSIISIEGAENIRDLGGIPLPSGHIIKSGVLYRGGNLSKITPAGARFLVEDLGVSLIVDLRVSWELEEKPDVELSGVENAHIPFYDREIVGIDYTEPEAGTLVVGRDTACNPDHFYRHMANELTAAQMGKAVQLILSHAMKNKPVYFHCSGGKDRAGIIALCLLTVLGASEESILQDYLLTNLSRDKHIDMVYQRFLRLAGGNEELAREITQNHRARPENLIAFREAVQERYGSMDAFVVQKLGMTPELVVRAREALTE